MRSIAALLFCMVAAMSVAQTNTLPPATNPAPVSLQLFNGRNLDGLQVYQEDASADPAKTWRVEDGILRCSGAPRGFIRTQLPFADYTLHVEWRWPKGDGNSGILLHVVNRDEIWPKGFEVQLATGRAGDLTSYWDARSKEEIVSRNPRGFTTGRLMRPGNSTEKPLGEWNTLDVVCAGDTVTLTVNGVQVNRMTGLIPSAGMIGLQSEGTAIDFRNITLKLLPPVKDLHAPMPR